MREAGPKIRRALVSRFGVDIGNELTNDVIAYAWEHWDSLATMENPTGYLCRVGQSAARRYHRWRRVPPLSPIQTGLPAEPEPELARALTRLKPDQRAAVVLVHGYGWSYAEAAAVLDIPITTLRNHLTRGLARLRKQLES